MEMGWLPLLSNEKRQQEFCRNYVPNKYFHRFQSYGKGVEPPPHPTLAIFPNLRNPMVVDIFHKFDYF